MCSVVLRSSFARSLLLDVNPYGGNDPDVIFSPFTKQVARELTHKLVVIFEHMVKRNSFPTCWRLADVVTVPN